MLIDRRLSFLGRTPGLLHLRIGPGGDLRPHGCPAEPANCGRGSGGPIRPSMSAFGGFSAEGDESSNISEKEREDEVDGLVLWLGTVNRGSLN